MGGSADGKRIARGRHRASRVWLAALLCAAMVSACGTDDHHDGDVTLTPTAPAPTATPTAATASVSIVTDAQALQPLPDDVRRVRVTGRDIDGAVTYGPHSVPYADRLAFQGVPVSAVTVQIDYLRAAGDAPVAEFRTAVDLNAGEVTLTNPAFVLSDDPVALSFVAIGCNRVASNALATNSPSSANVGQLVQDFSEIVDAERISPPPQYVFYSGDLVLNYVAGTQTLREQLQGWKALYTSTPLGMSDVPLVAIAGNHELLMQVTVTATPNLSATPGPAGTPTPNLVSIAIPNPPTGAVFTSEMADYIPADNGPTQAPPNLDHVERDESMLSFSFRDGPNLFIAVNTDTYIGGDTPAVTGYVPLNWLDAQLAAANADATIENVFVFGHRPVSSPDPSNLPIAPAQALPFYELLAAPAADGAPTKVRAYICAHAHLWDASVPAVAPPGNTLLQIIAGNGGSPVATTFTAPYYGYTVFHLTASGAVTLESWGRPVPTPYAAPPPQPLSTLHEQRTIYVPG